RASINAELAAVQSTLSIFTAPVPTEIYTLSLHDALPISPRCGRHGGGVSPAPIESETLAVPGDDGFGLEDEQCRPPIVSPPGERSEEHTSELQSPYELVCRLLLEKKKKRSNSDNGIASYH